MYHDKLFDSALREVKDESFQALKAEVISMERAISKFLDEILECTASIAERDFKLPKF